MQPLDIAYIAGFFDGEGCVSFGKSKDVRTPKGYTDRIRVIVSQIDRRPLDAISAEFGGNITLRTTRVHELVFTDMASISRFLISLLPYLIVKREVAEQGIAFCATRMATALEFSDRNRAVRELREVDPKRWTHMQLARRFGMSRRRIRQVLSKDAACL